MNSLPAAVKSFNKHLLTSYFEQIDAVAWDLSGFSTQCAVFQESLSCRQGKPISGPSTYAVLKELEEILEIMAPRHPS